MYDITDYSYNQARALGVSIKPSKKTKYKIDVHDKYGKYMLSIGAKGYDDYPTYIKTKGLEYANERRKLYKSRHNKDRHIQNSRGFFADKILW